MSIAYLKEENVTLRGLDAAASQIFLLLQQHPTISIKGIGDELGYSSTLIKARLHQLKEMGYLRPDREIVVPFTGLRLQTEVEADYDPRVLGLQRYNVVLRGISDMEKIRELETFLAIYPYSHYHVPAFATSGILFCQFDIPQGAENLLQEVLGDIRKLNYFASMRIIPQEHSVQSSFDFSKWSMRTNRWKIYQEQEFTEVSYPNEFNYLWRDFLSVRDDSPQSPLESSKVLRFDRTDLELLRELTINAKPVITDLAQHYAISRSRLSRRIARIRKTIVRNERLIYDQSLFDLTTSEIIIGKFRRGEDMNAYTLQQFLSSIPFSTTLVLHKNHYLWQVTCPPSLLPKINRFAWEHTDVQDTLLLDSELGRTYYFFHKNYDGKWKSDREYMVTRPLDTFKQVLGTSEREMT